jgi:hypothetical protein
MRLSATGTILGCLSPPVAACPFGCQSSPNLSPSRGRPRCRPVNPWSVLPLGRPRKPDIQTWAPLVAAAKTLGSATFWAWGLSSTTTGRAAFGLTRWGPFGRASAAWSQAMPRTSCEAVADGSGRPPRARSVERRDSCSRSTNVSQIGTRILLDRDVGRPLALTRRRRPISTPLAAPCAASPW